MGWEDEIDLKKNFVKLERNESIINIQKISWNYPIKFLKLKPITI